MLTVSPMLFVGLTLLLLTLFAFFTQGVTQFLLVVFAIGLFHFPAFLPTALQKKLLKPKSNFLEKYPEIPVPLLLVACWIMVGTISNSYAAAVGHGVLAIVVISICFVSVRLLNVAAAITRRASSLTKTTEVIAISTSRHQTLYMLRICAVALSLMAAVTLVRGVSLGFSSAVVQFILAAVVLMFSLVSYRLEMSLQSSIKSKVSRIIGKNLKASPASVALYYSGPRLVDLRKSKSKIAINVNAVELVMHLKQKKIAPAVILRESHSVNVMESLELTHVWHCPTMGQLDYLAQPTLKVILYANDGVKNGHFIRFNQFKHVLVPTGRLAKAETLHRGCEIYHAIIAPSHAKAREWRAISGEKLAERIFTVGEYSADKPEYSVAKKYPKFKPTITLHVGQYSATQSRVLALVKTVLSTKSAFLEVWFPNEGRSFTSVQQAKLYSEIDGLLEAHGASCESDDQLPVQLKLGTPSNAANAADFPIVHSGSLLDDLSATGKPLLWFDDALAPSSLANLGSSVAGFTSSLKSILEVRDENREDPMHFEYWEDLIASLSGPKPEGFEA